MYEANYTKIGPKNKILAILNRPFTFLFRKTTARKFFRNYLIIIFFGAVLLYTPFAQSDGAMQLGQSLGGLFGRTGSIGAPSGAQIFGFSDALFTAASAFSDTGLVVTTTYSQFTIFGEIIILSLILLGGIGVMAIKVMFWIFIGKKIGLQERLLIQSERGSSKIGGTYELIITAVQVIFVFIFIGIVLLWPYFYFVKQTGLGTENIPTGNIGRSLWHAVFHSVSAINNAGFDITGSASIAPYYDDIYVQIVFIVLLVAGGIGFPVFWDIKRWVRSKKKDSKEHHRFKWSLFTKITLVTYSFIVVFGIALSMWTELSSANPESLWNIAKAGPSAAAAFGRPFYDKTEVLSGIVFSVFSTRNAGFATIPMSYFQTTSRFLWSFLMWVGSSPASTAGGVRTTTIAIVMVTILASSRGKNRVFIFKRRIPKDTVRKAFVATVVSLLIMAGGTIVLMSSVDNAIYIYGYDNLSSWDAFFEVASAFGTTGLSTGVTPVMGIAQKYTIIVIMIIGQLGLSGTLEILSSGNHNENKFVFAEEDVIIG